MRVRVLTAKQGFKAGQIVDMKDADSARWIGAGDGEKVENGTGGGKTGGGKTGGSQPQGGAENASGDPAENADTEKR